MNQGLDMEGVVRERDEKRKRTDKGDNSVGGEGCGNIKVDYGGLCAWDADNDDYLLDFWFYILQDLASIKFKITLQ